VDYSQHVLAFARHPWLVQDRKVSGGTNLPNPIVSGGAGGIGMNNTRPKILLVDDKPDNLIALHEMLRENLKDKQADLMSASTGNEALSLVAQHNFALVLLDVQMPVMNSFEVASLMQQLEPNRLVPIVFLTAANDDNESMLKGYEAGAVDFIAKPLVPKIIQSKVKIFLQLHHQQQKIEQAQEELLHSNDALQEANKQLKFLAMHDSFTGLSNRALLIEHLTRIVSISKRRQEKFYVVFIDLDGFKNVNDSLGHGIGDILLLEVVGRVRKIVRAQDVMARVGGDEFVIVLSDCDDENGAVRVCKRINQVIEKKFVIENNEIFTSASIGVSTYPEDGPCPEKLIESADFAMYFAKRSGKNTHRLFQNIS
jgi:diguanylate cyclase (GGDEF)-like protein